MSNVWKNANESNTTNWSSDDNSNTTWEESQTGQSIIVDNSEQSSTAIGTFGSVAAATTSILGTKYHLLDDKDFRFGSDSDYRLNYSASDDGLVFKSSNASLSENMYSFKNSDDEIFGINYQGVLRFKNLSGLPQGNLSAGKLAFASNDLYISKS